MQQFITTGYAKSRMREIEQSVARAADQWTPPVRGPGLLDRVGLSLVAVGVSIMRDRGALDRLVAEQAPRAA